MLRQKSHLTANLVIDGQSCPIDLGMVPVIRWLNSLPGIKTEYCCEGDYGDENDGDEDDEDDEDEAPQQPYVIMTFKDFDNLKEVVYSLKELSLHHYYMQMRFGSYDNSPRFIVHWYTKAKFDIFKKALAARATDWCI